MSATDDDDDVVDEDGGDGADGGRWEQDFDVYFAHVEDKPASFVLDLAAAPHAPVATHPLRLSLRIPMRIPRPDGLRDAAELDALAALEDRFVEALEQKIDAIYVGRIVHDGHTTLWLYVPEQYREAMEDLPSITGEPGEYEPLWAVEDDPQWELYTEFLAPGPYELQTIWNRRLLKAIEEHGDKIEVPREVDHMAYFPSREQALAAAAQLVVAGYRVDDLEPESDADADGDDVALQFHREDRLSDGRPDEFVGEILDIILPHDGRYDGWGAPVVT